MDLLIVIVLCLLGIALIVIEVFLVPGTTFVGLTGIAACIWGVYHAFERLGTNTGIFFLVLNVAVVCAAVVYFLRSKTLDNIELKTEIDSTVAGKEAHNIAVGNTGKAVSRLNPMGKVRVNGITMEGKSASDFIDEGSDVEVLEVAAMQLLVKEI
ncbi:hypothetical protein SAMD00024442_93_2 [Candidatus Symbiothrix dinenymphae]|nr:hypothetical protein SAMD00024442_93_2 [Candidatus Symbiothrix dinenymphae]